MIIVYSLRSRGATRDTSQLQGMDFTRKRRAWKQISAQSSYCATLICTQLFEEASALRFISTLFLGNMIEGIVEAATKDEVELSKHKQFQVLVQCLSQLARLLQELEAKHEVLQIKDYVVSQPTLQQVFSQLSQLNE